MSFRTSHLWKSAFSNSARDSDVAKLEGAYLQSRELVSILVGEIGADLRQYTIHDITHLDALWGVASEIVGDIQINPLEGFVLGGAFLLHDAGMSLAAYPGGMGEITNMPLWKQILRQTAILADKPTDNEIQQCTQEFIRLEHANRAQDLPNIAWKAPDGATRMLIEDGTLRQKFGSFIGEISASHWWSIDKLANRLNRIIPAPPPFSSIWSIDLLKLSCILRVADAAHIDERRAPQFLWALRGPSLSKPSVDHWLFQSRLTQPRRDGDAIHYSSTSSFNEKESSAWWLAHDTLRMVDRELRNVDVILADLRNDTSRFAVRRVANCESPSTLSKSITVTDWVPIDTSLQIGDTVSLVERLGGHELYGRNPLISLRELIQNGADALRLRDAIQGTNSNNSPLNVKINLEPGDEYLEISDAGVGMNAESIKNNLLNFGESGWQRDPIFRDYPSLIRSTPKTSGKFGIGFFSVFMLGNRVEVTTRRFDKGFSDTLLLKFANGLRDRPVLMQGGNDRMLMDGGTSIKVWLDHPSFLVSAFEPPHSEANSPDDILTRLFPALDFPLEFYYREQKFCINGRNWKSESEKDMLLRTIGIYSRSRDLGKFVRNIRPIYNSNGEIVGRLAICPPKNDLVRLRYSIGAPVVVNGARSSVMDGFLGMVEGKVSRAARDFAIPVLSKEEWLPWLNEQAQLLHDSNIDGEAQREAAAIICAMGGDPGPLAICETSQGWLSYAALRSYIQERDEINLTSSFSRANLVSINNDIVMSESGYPSIIRQEGDINRHFDSYPFDDVSDEMSLKDFIIKIISEEWKLDLAMLNEYLRSNVSSMYGKYDHLVEVGQTIRGPKTAFAHQFKRDLSYADFETAETRAKESRIVSNDYQTYFGALDFDG